MNNRTQIIALVTGVSVVVLLAVGVVFMATQISEVNNTQEATATPSSSSTSTSSNSSESTSIAHANGETYTNCHTAPANHSSGNCANCHTPGGSWH